MDKWDYINDISLASDKRGNLLLELMERFNSMNLKDITEEQAKAFYGERISNNGSKSVSEISRKDNQ